MSDDELERKRSYYDQYAPFYDAVRGARYESESDVVADKDKSAEISFYVEQAGAADGPALELGCGTGRVYLELLRAGVEAYGIDISDTMLDRLRDRVTSAGFEPQVRRAEMQTLSPRRSYGSVLVPGRGFLHNLSLSDQRRTLANAYEALAPGGRFVCNFYPPDFARIGSHVGKTVTTEFDHEGNAFTVHTTEVFDDRLHNVIRGDREIRNEEGEIIKELSTKIKLITKDEFSLLLETTGFSEFSAYGGYDGSPHERVDQELVWVAVK